MQTKKKKNYVHEAKSSLILISDFLKIIDERETGEVKIS